MSAWFFIAMATIANVSLNLCLKAISPSLYFDTPLALLGRLLSSPWAWLGFISGVVLLASFALALRSMPLSVTYIVITCSAMVLLTVLGAVLGYESLSFLRSFGLAFIILGLVLVTQSIPTA
ncbi:hypothetical protein PEL8287_03772 [Roseovarius litorisediminis]|uniref:Uncharacterized protein n=1 Tax=Roseovarius litorisediminis TaxID=1312363 RepID=A0A1Y5TN87_9RHOB|nr:hypothetical protein [Roseovarius litorisediminis]SLN68045.1 hypothetical protein PEL8287_03772 [Roseovarius litorisediminis]